MVIISVSIRIKEEHKLLNPRFFKAEDFGNTRYTDVDNDEKAGF